MKKKEPVETIDPFQLLASEEKYSNPWISVREDKVIRPGGAHGIFGVVEALPGVSVVALDKQRNVYLVREFKYAIKKESLEIMSGGVEPNEQPLNAAKRELKEELGLVAEKWITLGVIDPFTTIIKSSSYLFLAQNLTQGMADPGEGEIIEQITMPFEDALNLVLKGDITHAASCDAILRVARILGK